MSPPGAAPAGRKSTLNHRRTRPAPKSSLWIPWTDRAGHFSPLKASVLALSLTPAAAVAWQTIAGTLGPEPAKAAVHASGLWTIRLLLLTLAVTPLRHLAHWPRVGLLRRQLGLTTLGYGLGHLALYVYWQGFDLPHVAAEIASRVYLTIGFAALVGLCVLGITSTDDWLRRLKHNWKRLHQIVFLIAILGIVHYFMQAKLDVGLAVMTAGFLFWLLAWRALPVQSHLSFLVLLALAPATALVAALLEFGWYGLATGVDPMRVLMANLSLAAGARPAVWAGVAALAIAGVAGRPHRILGSLPPPTRVALPMQDHLAVLAAIAAVGPKSMSVVQLALLVRWHDRYSRWESTRTGRSWTAPSA